MKPLMIAVALAAALAAGPALAQDPWTPHAPAIAAVDAGVRAPLEAYLRGHATGRADDFRPAFHPDAQLWGTRNGTLIRMTAEEYINRASGSPPADEAERRRWIEAIRVPGRPAGGQARPGHTAGGIPHTPDPAALDGAWLIVNKMFLAEPKPPA